jgi:3-(3-hydroxy-phenyl)propionate hydroxylase
MDMEGLPVTGPLATADSDYDVAIIGAGPVGLLLGNMLGEQGLRVLILEALPALIDYPRGVGMDDESLRALQSVKLVDRVLPHLTPFHIMRLVTGKGRVFASFDPQTDEFGWPRRNAFIQPLVDRELAAGLNRYACVELRLGHTATTLEQNDEGVTLGLTTADGVNFKVKARFLVGADGGRSWTRTTLGIPFEGTTHPNRWIVVDIADDPMGLPNAYLHADPQRPYASIALPHGIRRLEFMLFPGEGNDVDIPRDVLDKMLARVMPDPKRINLIRARIYTHNGRLASTFRKGRVLLAGDAAHIMPVWQGQGYNSGVRDAFNLGWKLALVAKGACGDLLLDSYGAERREHAGAMIKASEILGAVFSTRNPVAVFLRDAFTYWANFVPSVKRYVLEMRWKPMPRYKEGALEYGPRGFQPASPVGRMFIQPRVALADGWQGRLDDAIGNGFALICWGANPRRWMDPDVSAVLESLNTKVFWAVPMTNLAYEAERHPDITALGDLDRRLKQWFDQNPNTVVLLRPDRFVAINCCPQDLNARVRSFAQRIQLKRPGPTELTSAAPETQRAFASTRA